MYETNTSTIIQCAHQIGKNANNVSLCIPLRVLVFPVVMLQSEVPNYSSTSTAKDPECLSHDNRLGWELIAFMLIVLLSLIYQQLFSLEP